MTNVPFGRRKGVPCHPRQVRPLEKVSRPYETLKSPCDPTGRCRVVRIGSWGRGKLGKAPFDTFWFVRAAFHPIHGSAARTTSPQPCLLASRVGARGPIAEVRSPSDVQRRKEGGNECDGFYSCSLGVATALVRTAGRNRSGPPRYARRSDPHRLPRPEAAVRGHRFASRRFCWDNTHTPTALPASPYCQSTPSARGFGPLGLPSARCKETSLTGH